MSNWYRLKSSLFGILFALLSANLVWAQSEKDLENTGLEDSATIEQLKLFGDILGIVKELYVEEIDDAELVQNALNGALEALDPHSVYIPPVKFEEQQESDRREYGGLGIEVTLENELVKINYAIEDGPAYKSGLSLIHI